MPAMQIFALFFRRACFALLSVGLLAAYGCVSVGSPGSRYEAADRVAATGGLTKTYIQTKDFTLTAYGCISRPGEDITVYIEGDGFAWLSPTLLSGDPTPARPLVLQMAASDPAGNVAYLARPGQYGAGFSPGCDALYWSDRRFSAEVVDAMSEAIDRLRGASRSRKIDLVGYSGGAAIAVLVAARRGDIASLRTVAGNLDTEAVNRHHGVSPLAGSLNPIDEAGRLGRLPQRHFAGAKDTVIPPLVARSFLKQAGDPDGRRLVILEDVSHSRGWLERWGEILTVPPVTAR
ncbi:MAG: Alpha/beta hydrolase family protein [Syntrophorhabdus sp. PtaB.Bin047]|nr:MAG: Alpha/beta hydrolase family protein [Syntrophorhabdus sp. PtaB.Bin047]